MEIDLLNRSQQRPVQSLKYQFLDLFGMKGLQKILRVLRALRPIRLLHFGKCPGNIRRQRSRHIPRHIPRYSSRHSRQSRHVRQGWSSRFQSRRFRFGRIGFRLRFRQRRGRRVRKSFQLVLFSAQLLHQSVAQAKLQFITDDFILLDLFFLLGILY